MMLPPPGWKLTLVLALPSPSTVTVWPLALIPRTASSIPKVFWLLRMKIGPSAVTPATELKWPLLTLVQVTGNGIGGVLSGVE
jgi:hypothetical protein